MVTKLTSEQIAKFWPVIKYAVEESVPPIVGGHPDRMNRMLSAALSGVLEVWVSYQRPDNKFEAIYITQFLYDDASNTKNLLLYSLYGYAPIDRQSWIDGGKTMIKYAKENGCNAIIAYTKNDDAVKTAKMFGADLATFISVNVEKSVKFINGLGEGK